MTPATSAAFFRPAFDNFLHAPVAAEGHEMPLSVLSALVRLGVDPWVEAEELAGLPHSVASRRLAALIDRLPKARWTETDTAAIANRLVALLPSGTAIASSSPKKARRMSLPAVSLSAKLVLLAALAIAVLTLAVYREASPPRDTADVPAAALPRDK